MTGPVREMGVWLRMNNEESTGCLREERESKRELREESLKRGTRQKREKERENKSEVETCF